MWGKHSGRGWYRGVCSVHPHACGENSVIEDDRDDPRRFTPTRVGKTSTSKTNSRILTVHPHACGENDLYKTYKSLTETVHPHACGENCNTRVILAQNARFTPTRVGKTRNYATVVMEKLGSPPRVWGKLLGNGNFRRRKLGSPPRVWGKRSGRLFTAWHLAVHPHACGENAIYTAPHPALKRFTPTRVGKTYAPMQRRRTICGSPPRVWGKLVVKNGNFGHIYGSPPRVWGKRMETPISGGGMPVHPHACGENKLAVMLNPNS